MRVFSNKRKKGDDVSKLLTRDSGTSQTDLQVDAREKEVVTGGCPHGATSGGDHCSHCQGAQAGRHEEGFLASRDFLCAARGAGSDRRAGAAPQHRAAAQRAGLLALAPETRPWPRLALPPRSRLELIAARN
jgi:hypothetical protein